MATRLNSLVFVFKTIIAFMPRLQSNKCIDGELELGQGAVDAAT